MLGLRWHMFCKTWWFIHQLPQELLGWWGRGWGAHRQPLALPLATCVPPAPHQPLGFPQHCPSSCHGAGCSSGAPQPRDVCDIHTSQTSLLPSLQHLFKCFFYPSPSNTRWNYIHRKPRNAIQGQASNHQQPRQNQSTDTQFDSLSFPFF